MRDPQLKKFNCTMNFNFDLSSRSMLQQLADDRAVSMSKCVRDLIAASYRMRFNAEPKCATGQDCLCAQMHLVRALAQPTNEQLLRNREMARAAASSQNPPVSPSPSAFPFIP